MSESGLWDNIRINIGHTAHFSRVESPLTSPGFPDVAFCSAGKEGHLELKFTGEIPARTNTAVFGREGMRDSQIAWAHLHVKHGGNVWILAQVVHTLYLVPGRYCRTFNKMTMHELGKASHLILSPRIDWTLLAKTIRTVASSEVS